MPVLGIVALLILWWFLTITELVPPLFLPRPEIVVVRCVSLLATGALLPDIGITVVRLVLGLGCGILIGVPLGLLMGSYARLYQSLEAVVDFFRSIPVAALFPLFLLVFGIGNTSKVAITAYSTSLIIMINTIYGVHNASNMRRRVAASLGANRWQMFFMVTLPDSSPTIAAGIRTAVSLGLIVVLVGEMFMGGARGLGQKIYEWSLLYRVPEMYAAIILTGVLGYCLNKIFVFFENRTIHWRGLA
jgi:NitT/TauT family transport system permease protein